MASSAAAGPDRVSVGPYTNGDREACLAVFDSNLPKFFMPSERLLFERFLDNLPGPFLVLKDADGSVLACGGYAVNDDQCSADFCWGMVSSQQHGQGLGKKLSLERLRQIAADPNIEWIRLNTSQHTVGFYESLGFRRARVMRDGYGPGLDRYDMEWQVRRNCEENTAGSSNPGQESLPCDE